MLWKIYFSLLLLLCSINQVNASQICERILFISGDGTKALQYLTCRDNTSDSTINSNANSRTAVIDRKTGSIDSFYYIHPNSYIFDKEKNAIQFPSGNFATMREFDLSEYTVSDKNGIYAFKNWDGKTKNSAGHYGLWYDPGGFDSIAYVWVLPDHFEFVDYKASQPGDWVLRKNTLAYYGLRVNDVVVEIRYRPRQNAIYQTLKTQLDEEKTVEVRQESGAIKLTLLGTVLFASGAADLSDQGKDILSKLAKTLADRQDLQIVVEGHTDNAPIQGALAQKFATNWELSAARSLAVVRHMAGLGIAEGRLQGRAFGEHRPRQPNDSNEGRTQNRRIEVQILGPDAHDKPDVTP
jgi:outer membrane protein OmpA-like peptidoglycan-associated protein